MIAVIAARADAKLSARVFAKLRELRHKVEAEPGERHELEWQVMSQLEAVFCSIPDDVAAVGVLSSVTPAATPSTSRSRRTFLAGSRDPTWNRCALPTMT